MANGDTLHEAFYLKKNILTYMTSFNSPCPVKYYFPHFIIKKLWLKYIN